MTSRQRNMFVWGYHHCDWMTVDTIDDLFCLMLGDMKDYEYHQDVWWWAFGAVCACLDCSEGIAYDPKPWLKCWEVKEVDSDDRPTKLIE